MKCRQPGCTGTIVDGYCDVCGMPGPNGPVTSVTMSSAPAGVQGGACQQPGCTGHYVDGYCDVCGTPAAAPSAPLASHGTAAASTSTAIGAMAIGSARAVSFGDKVMPKRPSGQRSRVARIGAGITVVPPAPAIDPEKALMVDPQVPMDQRFCSNCGAKVGRTDTSGGREEGFCPQCGHPYSFTPKLKAGDVVAGQYEVAGSLAHGGMGWIYLARDRNLSNRWVVLKGLLNSDDADTAKAAIAEQQWLASLENPLIVEIYNFVTFEGSRYIVMEYVGGRSLKELLKQRLAANSGRPDPLPVDQALAFLIEILPAFSYLHDQGLVYCDFKPDQVMQVGDALKLIDLGGVRRITDDESALYGTIGYQAPEVAKAGASIASDIFTIGRTLMVLCADVPGYQTSYQYTTPPAEEMPAFAAHDSLYRLLLKACATDPADRFTSAEELRVQMLGILREVVGVGSGRTASTSAASHGRDRTAGTTSGGSVSSAASRGVAAYTRPTHWRARPAAAWANSTVRPCADATSTRAGAAGGPVRHHATWSGCRSTQAGKRSVMRRSLAWPISSSRSARISSCRRASSAPTGSTRVSTSWPASRTAAASAATSRGGVGSRPAANTEAMSTFMRASGPSPTRHPPRRRPRAPPRRRTR